MYHIVKISSLVPNLIQIAIEKIEKKIQFKCSVCLSFRSIHLQVFDVRKECKRAQLVSKQSLRSPCYNIWINAVARIRDI